MAIRRATPSDLETLTELFSRMYMLNSEFDPLLKVPDDIKERVRDVMAKELENKSKLIYVYEESGYIYAAIKISLDDRIFYEPNKVARIEEFYVRPSRRRSGLGRLIIKYVEEELGKMGITMLVARFPSKNLIASSFYTKNGFREIHSEYAKMISAGVEEQ